MLSPELLASAREQFGIADDALGNRVSTLDSEWGQTPEGGSVLDTLAHGAKKLLEPISIGGTPGIPQETIDLLMQGAKSVAGYQHITPHS